jgi:hypothetical protein
MGISDDWYRSTVGVVVIRFGAAQSSRENVWCTCEHLEALVTSLDVPMPSLEAPTTSLGVRITNQSTPTTSMEALVTSLGGLQITVERSGNNKVFFGNTASARLEIVATTYCSTIINTLEFSLYSHL